VPAAVKNARAPGEDLTRIASAGIIVLAAALC